MQCAFLDCTASVLILAFLNWLLCNILRSCGDGHVGAHASVNTLMPRPLVIAVVANVPLANLLIVCLRLRALDSLLLHLAWLRLGNDVFNAHILLRKWHRLFLFMLGHF